MGWPNSGYAPSATERTAILALPGHWRRRRKRPRSASFYVRTAMLRSRQESLACPRVLMDGSCSVWYERHYTVRGSSTGRCARLLTERLRVRVPPPEFGLFGL